MSLLVTRPSWIVCDWHVPFTIPRGSNSGVVVTLVSPSPTRQHPSFTCNPGWQVMNEVTLHRGRSPHLNIIDAFVDGVHLTEAFASLFSAPPLTVTLMFVIPKV